MHDSCRDTRARPTPELGGHTETQKPVPHTPKREETQPTLASGPPVLSPSHTQVHCTYSSLHTHSLSPDCTTEHWAVQEGLRAVSSPPKKNQDTLHTVAMTNKQAITPQAGTMHAGTVIQASYPLTVRRTQISRTVIKTGTESAQRYHHFTLTVNPKRRSRIHTTGSIYHTHRHRHRSRHTEPVTDKPGTLDICAISDCHQPRNKYTACAKQQRVISTQCRARPKEGLAQRGKTTDVVLHLHWKSRRPVLGPHRNKLTHKRHTRAVEGRPWRHTCKLQLSDADRQSTRHQEKSSWGPQTKHRNTQTWSRATPVEAAQPNTVSKQ